MSYENFKPTFWAEKILRENAKLTVLANLATREYEGEAKRGERVKILGIGKVAIKDYDGTPIMGEQVADTSIYIDINQAKYFAIDMDDVDKAQAKNVLSPIMAEANEGMADAEDTFIGDTLLNAKTPTPKTNVDESLARKIIINAKTLLRKEGVKKATKICAVVTPDFFEKLEIRQEELNTNNTDDLENGFDGKVSGVEIFVSNNLPKKNNHDVIFIFTKKRCFAHATDINEVEACRPSDLFVDRIKGLDCFGTKVVRPKELVSFEVTYA